MSRTIEGILDQMRDSLQESNSDLASFPQYGNLYAIFRAIATSIIEQDTKLDTIKSNLFLSTSTGDSLDLKAEEFNITRQPGSYASGPILILGNSVTIPANTVLIDNITGLQYVLNDQAVIISNKVKATVTCTEYSESGNLLAGTELFSSIFPNIKFIVGDFYDPLNSVYKGNLYGGAFKETDDNLKTRIADNIKALSLSNLESLKIAAQKIDGIDKLSIIENSPSLGYITVYINNLESKFLKIVKNELDLIKPIGTALEIKTFKTIAIDINISIQTYNLNNIDIKNSIQLKIQNYLNSLNPGDILTREALGAAILSIPEIYNLTINIPASNIETKESELLNLNSVNISYI